MYLHTIYVKTNQDVGILRNAFKKKVSVTVYKDFYKVETIQKCGNMVMQDKLSLLSVPPTNLLTEKL